MLKELNLPQYSFRITGEKGSEMIFDPIRKKYVRLTPEEWVRQNFVQYLICEGKYPPGLIEIEVMFRLHRKLVKRIDIRVRDRSGTPVLLVECKSYKIPVNDQKVQDQIGEYNMHFKVPYVIITNGMDHYAFRYDPQKNQYDYMMVIPLYEDLLS
jgi:hypothetical protein